MIAHVGGAPVEELLPMAAGTGTALVLARGWIAAGAVVSRIMRIPQV